MTIIEARHSALICNRANVSQTARFPRDRQRRSNFHNLSLLIESIGRVRRAGANCSREREIILTAYTFPPSLLPSVFLRSRLHGPSLAWLARKSSTIPFRRDLEMYWPAHAVRYLSIWTGHVRSDTGTRVSFPKHLRCSLGSMKVFNNYSHFSRLPFAKYFKQADICQYYIGLRASNTRKKFC